MNCPCKLPDGTTGYCERREVELPQNFMRLCQTVDGYRDLLDRQYGKLATVTPKRKRNPPREGPGTELHRILARWGIRETPSCACKSREREMNAWGPDKCLERIDRIVDWMAAEAKKRHLPFVRAAAVLLVRRAVRLARAKALQS